MTMHYFRRHSRSPARLRRCASGESSLHSRRNLVGKGSQRFDDVGYEFHHLDHDRHRRSRTALSLPLADLVVATFPRRRSGFEPNLDLRRGGEKVDPGRTAEDVEAREPPRRGSQKRKRRFPDLFGRRGRSPTFSGQANAILRFRLSHARVFTPAHRGAENPLGVDSFH